MFLCLYYLLSKPSAGYADGGRREGKAPEAAFPQDPRFWPQPQSIRKEQSEKEQTRRVQTLASPITPVLG